MANKLLYTFSDPPSERHLARAQRILTNDGILAYPVGANWAFGCDARSGKALDNIRLLKPEHPKTKSYSLLCADMSMASDYGRVDHGMYRVLRKMWPGPFTVIVKANRNLPRQLKDKRKVVGLRIPECPLIRSLVEVLGSPIASTSVPAKSDGTPYHMGYEIEAEFGHLLDLVLDLGDELTGEESTVIDWTETDPSVVRIGLGDIEPFGLDSPAD